MTDYLEKLLDMFDRGKSRDMSSEILEATREKAPSGIYSETIGETERAAVKMARALSETAGEQAGAFPMGSEGERRGARELYDSLRLMTEAVRAAGNSDAFKRGRTVEVADAKGGTAAATGAVFDVSVQKAYAAPSAWRSGTSDISMGGISDFFERDSRRYDGGFDIY